MSLHRLQDLNEHIFQRDMEQCSAKLREITTLEAELRRILEDTRGLGALSLSLSDHAYQLRAAQLRRAHILPKLEEARHSYEGLALKAKTSLLRKDTLKRMSLDS